MSIQFVFALPCRIPKINRSINPPENVSPTAIFNMCAIMYAEPASTTWTPNSNGATNRNENSKGSVIPVSIQVSAAESRSPPACFFFSGFAQ